MTAQDNYKLSAGGIYLPSSEIVLPAGGGGLIIAPASGKDLEGRAYMPGGKIIIPGSEQNQPGLLKLLSEGLNQIRGNYSEEQRRMQ